MPKSPSRASITKLFAAFVRLYARVQTDFKRIETTRSARILAEKQLQIEQERLRVGLSATRFVLDFQRDLATAQGNELRAIIDYNKSLSNLARHKATTLDRYHLELS